MLPLAVVHRYFDTQTVYANQHIILHALACSNARDTARPHARAHSITLRACRPTRRATVTHAAVVARLPVVRVERRDLCLCRIRVALGSELGEDGDVAGVSVVLTKARPVEFASLARWTHSDGKYALGNPTTLLKYLRSTSPSTLVTLRERGV